jgi:hypothetical protein
VRDRVLSQRLAPSDLELSRDGEDYIRTRLRPDVECLKAFMPDGFDGWGILSTERSQSI